MYSYHLTTIPSFPFLAVSIQITVFIKYNCSFIFTWCYLSDVNKIVKTVENK